MRSWYGIEFILVWIKIMSHFLCDVDVQCVVVQC